MGEDDKPQKPAEIPPQVSAVAGELIVQVTAMPSLGAALWQPMVYPIWLDLPAPILERVAAIAVHWAYAEYQLAGMQYCVHLLDRKAGRDYSLEPRLKDVTDEVTKIGKSRNLDFPFADWENFTGTLTECDKIRNQLLHAVWFYDEHGKLCIQEIKGEWPKKHGEPPRSKKMYPGKILINEAWLDTRLENIRNALKRIKQFSDRLESAVKTWREK